MSVCVGTTSIDAAEECPTGASLTKTSPPATKEIPSPSLVKKTLSYPSLNSAFDSARWYLPWTESAKGGSPYRGLTMRATRDRVPGVAIGILGGQLLERRALIKLTGFLASSPYSSVGISDTA